MNDKVGGEKTKKQKECELAAALFRQQPQSLVSPNLAVVKKGGVVQKQVSKKVVQKKQQQRNSSFLLLKAQEEKNKKEKRRSNPVAEADADGWITAREKRGGAGAPPLVAASRKEVLPPATRAAAATVPSAAVVLGGVYRPIGAGQVSAATKRKPVDSVSGSESEESSMEGRRRGTSSVGSCSQEVVCRPRKRKSGNGVGRAASIPSFSPSAGQFGALVVEEDDEDGDLLHQADVNMCGVVVVGQQDDDDHTTLGSNFEEEENEESVAAAIMDVVVAAEEGPVGGGPNDRLLFDVVAAGSGGGVDVAGVEAVSAAHHQLPYPPLADRGLCYAHTIGWERKDVAMNGDCLFDSVLLSARAHGVDIGEDLDNADKLRAKLVSWMGVPANKCRLAKLITSEFIAAAREGLGVDRDFVSLSEHIQRLSRRREWGCEVELICLCTMLNLRIEVVTNQLVLSYTGCEFFPLERDEREIAVYFNGRDHYQALVPAGSEGFVSLALQYDSSDMMVNRQYCPPRPRVARRIAEAAAQQLPSSLDGAVAVAAVVDVANSIVASGSFEIQPPAQEEISTAEKQVISQPTFRQEMGLDGFECEGSAEDECAAAVDGEQQHQEDMYDIMSRLQAQAESSSPVVAVSTEDVEEVICLSQHFSPLEEDSSLDGGEEEGEEQVVEEFSDMSTVGLLQTPPAAAVLQQRPWVPSELELRRPIVHLSTFTLDINTAALQCGYASLWSYTPVAHTAPRDETDLKDAGPVLVSRELLKGRTIVPTTNSAPSTKNYQSWGECDALLAALKDACMYFNKPELHGQESGWKFLLLCETKRFWT